MSGKLQEICEEILKNETESKKFMALQTPEEMYDYFKEKMPELTEDEFDSFIVEALDSYVQIQNQEPDAITEALDSVSGGANFGKFSKQMVASAMAALSMSSAAMATGPQTNTTANNINTINTQNTIKQTGKFKKFTNWVKNHKALSNLIGVGAIVVATVIIDRFVIGINRDQKESKDKVNTEKLKKIAAEIKKASKNNPPNFSRANYNITKAWGKMNTAVEKANMLLGFCNLELKSYPQKASCRLVEKDTQKPCAIRQIHGTPKIKETFCEILKQIREIQYEGGELFDLSQRMATYLSDHPECGVTYQERSTLFYFLAEEYGVSEWYKSQDDLYTYKLVAQEILQNIISNIVTQ